MSPDPEKLPIQCSTCGCSRQVKPTKKDSARLPRGWKRIGESIHCGGCWGRAYRVSAITMSVASPVSCDWPTLRKVLREALVSSTALANWTVDTLVAGDVRRQPTDEKMPPRPPIYLYALAKDSFSQWEQLDAQSANSLMTEVERTYSSERYDCLWTGSRSVRRYRYPYPYPLSSQSVTLSEGGDGGIVVSIRLGGERQSLRLKTGGRYWRQTQGLRHLIQNPELLCGCQITIEKHAGERDRSSPASTPGGGNGHYSDIRVKIVGWFPAERPGPLGTLCVNTTVDSLLVAVTPDGNRIWTYHADHAKRMVAAHDRHMRKMSRLSDDHKAERRKPRHEGVAWRDMLENRSRIDSDRITSLCHEVSAGLAAFSARQRVAQVMYDDSERGFANSFPWAKLKTMLGQKLRAKGIDLIDGKSSGSVAEKPLSPLDRKETAEVQ